MIRLGFIDVIACLAVTLFGSTLLFMDIMYGPVSNWSWEALLYGVYFSVQTVTTTGYGDWIPPNVSGLPNVAPLGERIFRVKILSIFLMLFGAALFAAAVSAFIKISGTSARWSLPGTR